MFRYFLILIISLPFLGFNCQKESNSENLNDNVPLTGIELFLQLVNQVRLKGATCGNKYLKPVSPLVLNELLNEVALEHSKYMNGANKLDHIGKNGTRPADRLREAGYYYSFFGENIAFGASNEEGAFQLWMNSPGHCEIIMDPAAKEIGIASSGKYWTMIVGSR